MKLNTYRQRRPRQFDRLAALTTIAILELIPVRPRISGPRKAANVRRLTLSLLALTLLVGTMAVGPSVRARQEFQKPISSLSMETRAGGVFREKLMSAPSVPGTEGAADAQATVDVSNLHEQPKSTVGVGNSNAGETKVEQNSVLPADIALPDPTVAILPTPLGLQSSTDIPDFSMAASDLFIVTANSQTIYFQ